MHGNAEERRKTASLKIWVFFKEINSLTGFQNRLKFLALYLEGTGGKQLS